MSEITTPTPEAPVAPVTATVSTPSTDRPLTPDIVVDLSPDQRKAVLRESFEKPKDAPKPAEPVVPVEVVAEPVPVAEQVELPAEEKDEPEDITKNFRLHTTDPKQSAFIKAYKAALAVNPNVNPADVARMVGLEETPADEQPTFIPQIPVQHADVTAAQATLTALDAQIEAIEDGTLVTKDVKALLTKRSDALAQLSEAKLRSEFANQREQDRQATRLLTAKEACKIEVLHDYPTASDDNSELGTEIARIYAEVQQPSHPDNRRLSTNDFPRWITEKAAKAAVARLTKNLGLTEAQALSAVKGQKPEATSPAIQPPKQPATVPRTVLVTAPGGQAAPTPLAMTPQQMLEAARSNPKLRRAALGLSNGVTIG